VSEPTRHCGSGEFWNGKTCTPVDKAKTALADARAAIADVRLEEAVAILEKTRSDGPHTAANLVAINEQLGIAHAYLGHEAQALEAFETLLTIQPKHALKYTLSPRALFVFDKARKKVAQRAEQAVEVSWPRNGKVNAPVPVDIEVLADPRSFLANAVLFVRRRGEVAFAEVPVHLKEEGSYQQVVLPSVSANKPEVLELYLSAYDAGGNEVLKWASPERPREISLRHVPPTKWYRKWWVWTIAGSAVAAGTGTMVYFLTREPPSSVPVTATVSGN
jgi:tetratricopeptide (TPR) repeat protein